MYEREIEDVLAEHPELIEEGLTLLGRQVAVAGRRMDLLFEDKNKRKLIVELKRGTIKDDHVGQVISYAGGLLTQEDPTARIMLVGTRVPPSFQKSLDHFGIAWKELSTEMIARYLFVSQERQSKELDPQMNRPKDESESDQRSIVQSPIGTMPRKGDVFKGKVNDLCLQDKSEWRRRDISFIKCDLTEGKRFAYPAPHTKIVLVDTDGVRYDLNVTEPHSDDKVCIGTPGRLKPWYQKKGFLFKRVNPDEIVYFEYMGRSNEFLIFTEEEYDRRFDKATSLTEGQQIAEPAVPPDRQRSR
jgi:hypothetical protein